MTRTESAGAIGFTAETKEIAAADFSSIKRLTNGGTKESSDLKIVKGAGTKPAGRSMSWGYHGEKTRMKLDEVSHTVDLKNSKKKIIA